MQMNELLNGIYLPVALDKKDMLIPKLSDLQIQTLKSCDLRMYSISAFDS